jgi:hypothetical protein
MGSMLPYIPYMDPMGMFGELNSKGSIPVK